MLILRTPTEMRLQGYETRREELQQRLKYRDKKVEWTLKKFKSGAGWFIGKFGEDAYTKRLTELKAEQDKSVLFEDGDGMWTYSGLRPSLAEHFGDEVLREYDLPGSKLLPWTRQPKNQMRYYQEAALENLLEAANRGPAAVEMGTGLGKSFIIMMLLKRLALPSVVMTPSKSIAKQIYADLLHHFGPAKVGFFGDGKKQFTKLFTVAIGASLTKVEPGDQAWDAFRQAKVFIADESHTCPAAMLSKVCLGLCSPAPYRFFFSGTQMRGDGLDLVLEGITGPIVYRMTVQEGVDQGFLSKPVFKMCWTESRIKSDSSDPNDLTRDHVYYNPDLNQKAAELANKSVGLMGRPTLILVEEHQQVAQLLPHLRYEARFAHGGVTKANRDKIPSQFHDSDTSKLVEAFNAREFPILIGTSCIATGTDLRVTGAMLYLRGGRSEIEVKQGVGRCTRLSPGKEDCVVIDFGISNVETLARHAAARKEIFADIYPGCKDFTL